MEWEVITRTNFSYKLSLCLKEHLLGLLGYEGVMHSWKKVVFNIIVERISY